MKPRFKFCLSIIGCKVFGRTTDISACEGFQEFCLHAIYSLLCEQDDVGELCYLSATASGSMLKAVQVAIGIACPPTCKHWLHDLLHDDSSSHNGIPACHARTMME